MPLIGAFGCFGANWAIGIPYMLSMVALAIVSSRIGGSILLSYNADIIPVPLRLFIKPASVL